MPVKVKCSGCEAVLNVPDRARGKGVKCPKCGKGIRVPAASPAKRRPATVASGDSGEFFSGLDLDKLEDRTARVCPRCGSVVGAEDVDCPSCGADLVTGGMGTAQRARAGRKGAAPSEYYSKALKDAGRYWLKKQNLAWKSALVLTIFPVLAQICFMMFIWCHNWPPRLFWTFVGVVCALLSPGWIWLVQNQFIKRTLDPKLEKYPIRFEPFIAVSLGIKSVAWMIVFGFPIWLLFALPAGVLLGMGSPSGLFLLLAAYGIFLITMALSWPIAQAHFAMPITWPGWMLHKVLPDVGKNIGPCLYWATFAFLTIIPVGGVAIGSGLLTAPKTAELQTTLAYNSKIGAAQQAIAEAEDRKTEPPAGAAEVAAQQLKEIDWTLLLWSLAGQLPYGVAMAFWMVFNLRSAAFLVKLFRPNMDNLLMHEKEYVYVAKSAEERVKLHEESQNVSTVFASVGVAVALGFAGGAIYATMAENVGFLYGMGVGIAITSSLTVFGARVTVAKMAFEESAAWGIGCFLFDIVLLIYCIKNWARMKLPFLTYLLASVTIGVGFGLMVAGIASEAAAEAAAQAPAAN